MSKCEKAKTKKLKPMRCIYQIHIQRTISIVNFLSLLIQIHILYSKDLECSVHIIKLAELIWKRRTWGWETNPTVKYMFFVLRFIKCSILSTLHGYLCFLLAHTLKWSLTRTNSNLIKMVLRHLFSFLFFVKLCDWTFEHKIRSNRSNTQSCHIFYFANLSSLLMHKHIRPLNISMGL